MVEVSIIGTSCVPLSVRSTHVPLDMLPIPIALWPFLLVQALLGEAQQCQLFRAANSPGRLVPTPTSSPSNFQTPSGTENGATASSSAIPTLAPFKYGTVPIRGVNL